MNARFGFTALILALGLSASTLVSTSVASPPKSTLLLQPGGGSNYGLPKFGFSSTNTGFGERIQNVRWGSRAESLGLEPGDVILSLNGYQLNYPGSWTDALSQALYNGNFVRLKVRDVRTGNVRFRETWVDYNNGPVQHYYKSNSGAGNKPFVNATPVVPKLTIKDLKKLVN
jgi:predicted metalloprotease with PDZ domain